MLDVLKSDSRVTKVLGEIIKGSQRDWANEKAFREFTEQEFLERPIPVKDVPATFCGVPLQGHDDALKECCDLLGAKKSTNSIYYPPKSMLPWHTNSDLVGVRTYYTFSMEGGIFRYLDPETNDFVNVQDKKGWNVNRFPVIEGKPFWHTVWARGRRFSFGFMS